MSPRHPLGVGTRTLSPPGREALQAQSPKARLTPWWGCRPPRVPYSHAGHSWDPKWREAGIRTPWSSWLGSLLPRRPAGAARSWVATLVPACTDRCCPHLSFLSQDCRSAHWGPHTVSLGLSSTLLRGRLAKTIQSHLLHPLSPHLSPPAEQSRCGVLRQWCSLPSLPQLAGLGLSTEISLRRARQLPGKLADHFLKISSQKRQIRKKCSKAVMAGTRQ